MKILQPNAYYYLLRETEGSEWGEESSWAIVDEGSARIESQSGGEQVAANQLGRNSTHRLYVEVFDGEDDDRIAIENGDYKGVYLVRYIDVQKAGRMRFVQIDVEYISALQGSEWESVVEES